MRTENVELCIEGQNFLRSYDSTPCPPPPPSESSTGDTQEDRKVKVGLAQSRII
jgi:hypothetical protein